ncbi:hypothetical protein GUITHDRAFT_111009 [Guillardia theta CCMP2712]|uniref:HTH myb-type domain-containing protein n=1 Tax=Guillardia theta (strain CCMP2712) TaxID=905079 RepID=L1J376_GUITC|nr:hypothetical protein GUITHDRAFT_111009 [Guillardia theta CCMP2712]EKX42961.1 hypothetical protein GUITHDRAFT_111009 [Guillardia theta CCMP2712]|eukprot:XP_005829941.1 hypothetical protein GUITHDRAFT_111009 [Guillardia theta CCMP2712]
MEGHPSDTLTSHEGQASRGEEGQSPALPTYAPPRPETLVDAIENIFSTAEDEDAKLGAGAHAVDPFLEDFHSSKCTIASRELELVPAALTEDMAGDEGRSLHRCSGALVASMTRKKGDVGGHGRACSSKDAAAVREAKSKRVRRQWTSVEHGTFVEMFEKLRDKSLTDDPPLGLGAGVAETISLVLKTRTPAQVRSHAQKYFTKIRKEKEKKQEGGNCDNDDDDDDDDDEMEEQGIEERAKDKGGRGGKGGHQRSGRPAA